MAISDEVSATRNDPRAWLRSAPHAMHLTPGHKGAEPPGTTKADRVMERFAELLSSARLLEYVLGMQTAEIQGLLWGISYHATLLEQIPVGAPDANVRARESMGRIQRALERLKDIVDGMPFVAPRGVGNLVREVCPRRVTELAELAVSAIDPLTFLREVHVTIEVVEAADTLACDRAEMVQVIAALLMGAVRRTPTNGNVRFVATHTGTTTRLAVHDEGAFLTHAEVAELLASKPLPDVTLTPHPISMARRGIELHGGRLEARPGDPRGMVFDAIFEARSTDG